MMEYKIEKGIPVPANDRGGRKKKYPFEEMKVGDSFLIDISKRSKVAIARTYWQKKLNAVFTVLTISKTQARVWRTK